MWFTKHEVANLTEMQANCTHEEPNGLPEPCRCSTIAAIKFARQQISRRPIRASVGHREGVLCAAYLVLPRCVRTFSTSAFVTLMSASILSKCCCALSASLQSLSNFFLHWNDRKHHVCRCRHAFIRDIQMMTELIRHSCLRPGFVCSAEFLSVTEQPGFVKVCSLQIKLIFTVAVCGQKNKHSSEPLSTPLSEQSVFVGPVCTLNCASAPHSQCQHWAHRGVRGGQGHDASPSHFSVSSKGPGGDKKCGSGHSTRNF